jgi:hypothetical protein
MLGFKLLNEMSEEELTEEILDNHRAYLKEQDREFLLMQVIAMRTHNVKHKLLREAEIEPPDSIFGNLGYPQ